MIFGSKKEDITMKMNRFFTICAALLAAAVSCNKAEMTPENEGGKC